MRFFIIFEERCKIKDFVDKILTIFIANSLSLFILHVINLWIRKKQKKVSED